MTCDPDFILDQMLILLTLPAIAVAIVSGVSFGMVVHTLRSNVEVRVTTWLAVALGLCWYLPQMAQLAAVNASPWATFSKLVLYLGGFVLPMWVTLCVQARRRE